MSDDTTRAPTHDPQGGTRGALHDEAQAERIAEFWDTARSSAVFTGCRGAAGERSENVMPPAWAFGDSPGLADELLALVLEGRKTAAASLVVEFEDAAEPVPATGDLSIVLDGRGEPRALIRTTQVEIVAFAEVTAEHTYLEGEGDRTLEAWRTEHKRAWCGPLGSLERELDPSMLVVCERFTVLCSA
ncbi:hypothetical protein GCM10009809_40810 [Isoptericola hypogeus]|uniref:ASCH domain-containing protein n=1 Tax=Isoptericola hypogeus TaxID=300179 RepID=A0ABP4W059_9MICO